MRLKNISDQEVVQIIKRGDAAVLPPLFERNYVNALNIGEKNGLSQKKVQSLLAHSCILIWQYFSSNKWVSSKHKVDFIIDYIFRVLVNNANAEANVKYKATFSEFEALLQLYFQEPKESEVSNAINNLKVLKDHHKHLIWNHFFEKKSIDKVAKELGFDEEKAEKQLYKGFISWADLIKNNLKKNIDIELLKTHAESVLKYANNSLRADKSVQHEVNLSTNKDLQKLQIYIEEMAIVAQLSRRLTLKDFITKNASTRLTGNIWGNKTSIASAIFIVVIGILVWVSDNTPEDKKNLFNLEEQVTDTIEIKSNEDSIQ